jgi:hypothetical protein
MWRTAPPLTAIKVEHVRNGNGLDVGTKLAVALQDQVVVAEGVVLHVAAGMRGQRRAVWILGVRIERTLPALLWQVRRFSAIDLRSAKRTLLRTATKPAIRCLSRVQCAARGDPTFRWSQGCRQLKPDRHIPHGAPMKAISLVWIGLPSAAFQRAASSSLSESCAPAIAEQIWSRTLHHQRDLKSRRPRGWSLGIQLSLRYMEWYVALYRASLEHGVSREQAGGMVEEIAWSINKPLVAALFRLSRLRSSELRIRIRWMYDVMFMLFFTAPFRRRVLASTDGVAFDMIACPAAAYCRDMGVPELTSYAACSFDARLAREYGVPFHKTQSIAEGAPLCDIRFFSRSVNQR